MYLKIVKQGYMLKIAYTIKRYQLYMIKYRGDLNVTLSVRKESAAALQYQVDKHGR